MAIREANSRAFLGSGTARRQDSVRRKQEVGRLGGLPLSRACVSQRLVDRHGLSPSEYLRRWGLKTDHPLTAPVYSERRSTLAKSLGLGRKATAATPAEAPMPIAAAADSAPKDRCLKAAGATWADVVKGRA